MSYEDSGVMDQIRERFHNGLTCRQIIDLGYPRSTTYKVRSQLQKKGLLGTDGQLVSEYDSGDSTWTPMDSINQKDDESKPAELERADLRADLETMRQQVADMEILRADLSQANLRIYHKDLELHQIPPLMRAIGDLEQNLAKVTNEKELALGDSLEIRRQLEAVQDAKVRVDSRLKTAIAESDNKTVKIKAFQQADSNQKKTIKNLEDQVSAEMAREEQRGRDTCPECGCPWERHQRVIDLLLGESLECPFTA